MLYPAFFTIQFLLIFFATIPLFYWVFLLKFKPYEPNKEFNNLLDYSICILLPMRNEASNAKRKIIEVVDEIKNFDKIDILIVNSDSNDETEKISNQTLKMSELAENRWKILTSGKPGKSIAINVALEHIDCDFIIMMDTDSSLDSGWLKTITNGFYEDEIGLISGFEKLNNSKSTLSKLEYKKYSNALRSRESGLDSCFVVEGSIIAWRTAVMGDFRLLENSNADDCQLACQAVRNGFRSVLDKNLKFWNHEKKYESEFKRSLRRAQGLSRVLTKNIGIIFESIANRSKIPFIFSLYFYVIFPWVLLLLFCNSLFGLMIFGYGPFHMIGISFIIFLLFSISKFARSLFNGVFVLVISHILLIFGIKFYVWNNIK